MSLPEPNIYDIRTKGPGPAGELPLTAQMLTEAPSGDIFGWTQNAGMGWDPRELGRKQFLILSTQGGMRAPNGQPALSRLAPESSASPPATKVFPP